MEYVDQTPQTLLPHTLFPMVNRRATMSAMFVKCNILGLLYALVYVSESFLITSYIPTEWQVVCQNSSLFHIVPRKLYLAV